MAWIELRLAGAERRFW